MIIMMIWKPGNDRGQVSLDYIIAITIFIFSFLFMYNLLTGLLLPFQINAGEVVPMAERASTVLAESSSGLAISESNPNVIDLDKAKWLNSSLNDPSQYDNMLSQLGLSTTNINYNINVSLRHINNTLYKNLGKTVLNAGRVPDDYSNVGKITRVVYLYPDILLLDVRVWL